MFSGPHGQYSTVDLRMCANLTQQLNSEETRPHGVIRVVNEIRYFNGYDILYEFQTKIT